MATPETTDDTRAEARANRANRAARIGLLLIALLVLYVLSIGPVFALMVWANVDMEGSAGGFVNAFYMPVGYLGSNTPLRGPLEKYIDWWVQLVQ